jgi:PilZ domain
MEIDAVVHRSDGTKVPVRVSNFSDQGCRIETDRDFHIGERLQIAVPRMGNVKAQVRWALPGAAGTRFLTESDF